MPSESSKHSDHTGPAAIAAAHRFFDLLCQLCVLMAGIGLVFMVISFGWVVYGRYVLNDTPTWVGQLALLLIIYIVCLGAAAGIFRHTHLSIDFIRNELPRAPRAILHCVADVMVVVFGVTMAWQGWALTVDNANHTLAMLNITASWRAIPLVFCGVLIVIFTVFDFLERLFTKQGEAR